MTVTNIKKLFEARKMYWTIAKATEHKITYK